MAADQAALMECLGFDRFAVAGHDRGARVAHRLCLDHPHRVRKAAVLDIAPTLTMYEGADMDFAMAYYHWFFLTQPAPLPEKLIGADPGFYLRSKLAAWSGVPVDTLESVFAAAALAEYQRCFRDPATIHGTCEDYRAAASVDLDHDRADRAANRKIACPLLALWGDRGVIARTYDVLEVWRRVSASEVSGAALPCGHFLAEEAAIETRDRLHAFFA
jgi:haloacetate dehalogenase